MRHLSGIPFLVVLFSAVLYVLSFAGWTDPVRISEPGGCLYPQILAQGDTIHVAYTNGSGGYYVGYVRSADAGNTWSDPVVLCDTNETEEAMFVRVLQFEEKIIVIWRNISNDVRRFNLGYAISLDNGETWGDPQLIFANNWDRMGYFTAQASDSVISIVISKWVSPDLVFYSLRSTNFGQSWSNPVEILQCVSSNLMDGAALDSLFHIAWGGSFSADTANEAYYIRSTDWGQTWSEPAMLSEADQYGSYRIAICVNQHGVVRYAWTDYKTSLYWWTGDIFLRESLDFGISWTPEEQLTLHHRVNRPDIISSGDTINIAWDDERPENGMPSIYYINSTDGGLSWSEEYRLDQDEFHSRNPALASSNAKVCVIWADDRNYPPADIYPGIYFRRYEEGTSISGESMNLRQAASISAHPNPFNSITTILYADLNGSEAINILNTLGQVVRTFNIQNRKEGQVVWDGTDAAGEMVSSGIYFARATGNSGAQTIKLVYLK